MNQIELHPWLQVGGCVVRQCGCAGAGCKLMLHMRACVRPSARLGICSSCTARLDAAKIYVDVSETARLTAAKLLMLPALPPAALPSHLPPCTVAGGGGLLPGGGHCAGGALLLLVKTAAL